MGYDMPEPGGPPIRTGAPRVVDYGRVQPPVIEAVGDGPKRAVRVRSRDPEPEFVTPLGEDAPGFVRRIGLRLLNRQLWTGEPRFNPVYVYVASRRHGGRIEDVLGLTPWVLLGVAMIVLFLLKPAGAGNRIALYGGLAVPLLALLATVSAVAFHLRGTIASVPFDELFLTRLKPEEIVQGLLVRPLSVQHAGVAMFAVLHGVLGVWAAVDEWGLRAGGLLSGALAVAVSTLLLFLGTAINEMAAAQSIRAQLFIRAPLVAWLRSAVEGLVVVVGTMLLMLVGLVLVSATCLVLLAVPAFFVLGAGFERFMLRAHDAIRWSVRFRNWWWAARPEGMPEYVGEIVWPNWTRLEEKLCELNGWERSRTLGFYRDK
ncbi:MAG: hypothetical protein SF028_10085 [Candidatus Sumerlaeia bacterium]|nr:hypothetical protein [Candidatus Sumerlaeia bacterium]